MKNKIGSEDEERGDQLLKVLGSHYRSLVEAGSDDSLLKTYAALLRFLKRQQSSLPQNARQRSTNPRQLNLSPNSGTIDLKTASFEELSLFVNDEATPRKELERVATERFSVPSGSIRSFSNRKVLVDKIRTLIENERAHTIIGAVARGNRERGI